MLAKLDARTILCAVLIAAAVLYDFSITFFKPIADPNLVGTILGVLNGTGFSAVVQYYFGSSSGSKEKDAQLAALAGPKT